MLFLFGTRTTNKNYFKIEAGHCPNCGSNGTLYCQSGSKYFHIFFFPFLSLGRAVKVTCSHCQKTLDYDQLPEDAKKEIDMHEAVAKKPAWQSCGCMLILLLLVFLGISTCTGRLFSGDDEAAAVEEANRPYKEIYDRDQKHLTTRPDIKTDKVSYYIKQWIDTNVNDELEKDKYKYYSTARGNRLLVIMKVTDMKDVAASERRQLVTLIDEALEGILDIHDKEVYIIVEGKWNTILVSTPTESDLGGRFADESLIYDFYKPELTKNRIAPIANDTVYDIEPPEEAETN